MPEIEIRIPGGLGLSEDELKQLKQKLEAQLVETVRGTQAAAVAAAKVVDQVKVEVAKANPKVETVVLP